MGDYSQVNPAAAGSATDVTDRAARLVGHVSVDNFPGTQPVSGTVTGAPPAWGPKVGSTPGLYLAIPSANTDPGGIAIPAGAQSVLVWFETSSSNAAMVDGRAGFNTAAAAVGSLTGTDTNLGYLPAQPVELMIPAGQTYLHLASATAGAVARGLWTFA